MQQSADIDWEAGILAGKLRPYQVPVYEEMWDAIVDPGTLMHCLNISRRWGKTTVRDIIHCEVAMRLPGAQIRFCGPTGIEIRKIYRPIMRQVLADCPAELRPRFNSQDKVYTFPNGSEIHLAGVNNGHEDDQRGTKCHLFDLDEAGFIDEIEYLIDDVLMPQTLDTGGTGFIGSTPPNSPAHPYFEIAQQCERDGHYTHRDIYSMGLDDALLQQYAKAAGGVESSTWKREYLAQFVVDSRLAAVPEWSSDYVREPEIDELRHPYWHRYEGMDLGVADNTACLFGYYDFANARLQIEDEWVKNGPELTTDGIATGVRAKEEQLGYRAVHRRISDSDNPLLLNDLRIKHGLGFTATSKDELAAMFNELRLWVAEGRVWVHPRCENLLGCLQYGVWKSERHIGRELDRSRAYGHFDALMALVYLVRNIDVHTNPVPADLHYQREKHFVRGGAEGLIRREQHDHNTDALRQMFSRQRMH